jgi:CheY-like chemotaxis protein
MNGLELFEALRASPDLAHIPFMFISGDAAVKLEKTTMLDVADAKLAKPFRMAPFLRTVASLLDAGQGRSEAPGA